MHIQAVVYRAHDPRWAWTPLSGEGARRRGGRFNRLGLAALSLSFSLPTAVREVSPIGRRMQPLVLCAYEADVDPVFDALDPSERAAHSIRQAEIDCPAWRNDMFSGRMPASQALADRLIAAGFAGMRVGSYALGASDRDVNLVLWRWGEELPSRVVLIDEEHRLGLDR